MLAIAGIFAVVQFIPHEPEGAIDPAQALRHLIADCNVPMAGALDPAPGTSGELNPVPGQVCPGYFLQIKAIKTFSFRHGGEWIPVRRATPHRA